LDGVDVSKMQIDMCQGDRQETSSLPHYFDLIGRNNNRALALGGTKEAIHMLVNNIECRIHSPSHLLV